MGETALIAKREFTEIVRDGRFRALAALLLLSISASALFGFLDYGQAVERRESASRIVRDQWIRQGVHHPHSGAHFGVYTFKAELPLVIADSGLKPFVGQTLSLESHTRNHFRDRPVEDATAAIRFQQLTPAFVGLCLVPLLIILVSYSSITAERERGTLAQLLATGVKPVHVLAGKAVGIAAALGLSLVPGWLILTAFIATAPAMAEYSTWARWTLLSGTYCLYFLIVILVSLAASAVVRQARTALALLICLWVANTLLLPRLASGIGTLAAPTPSKAQFDAAIRRDIRYEPDGSEWAERWSKELIASTLKKYGVKKIEDLPVGYAGVMLKSSDAHYEAVMEKHFSKLYGLYREQSAWHLAASFLGPMIAARSLSQGFAGMDAAHYGHFANSAERYRRTFVNATNEAAEKMSTGSGWSLKVGQDFWASIPAFRYEMPTEGWALAQMGLSASVLAAWLLLALCACGWSLRFLRRV